MDSWFPKNSRLQSARESIAREAPPVRALRLRSRELFDAAKRLGEQHDTSPVPHACVALHRDGALIALHALLSPDAPTPTPAALFDAATPGHLALMSNSASDLPKVRALLCGEELPDGAELLSVCHERLLGSLEREERAYDALLITRAVWVGASVFAISLGCLVAIALVAVLKSPTNLLEDKPWRTSSVGLVCRPADHLCGGTRTDIFFHTNNEPEPWIEFDLGVPTSFSRMLVQNRRDMGASRAVPLLVEASDDQKTWRKVIERKETFNAWEPTFPAQVARYVRLRVAKKTWFHLEAVEVYP